MIVLDLSILNQKGTPMFYSDLTANRPTAGIVGRIFIATDSPYGVFRDNGTSWDQIAGSGGGGGITGSGTATRVAFWDTASSISSNANLYWDNTNSRLGIGNASPGAPLDVHGTGTNAQFNGTGTNNAFLVFQNAGVSKWQIGNVYSTGSNYFRIYDTVNSLERFKVENTGSITTGATITASGSSTGYQGIYNSNSVTIPASTTFASGGYTFVGYNQYYFQNFGGSATFQNNNIDAAIFGLNRIDFSAAGGTITMTQSTGVRAMSAAAFQNQYNGTNSGTITHLSGAEILGFYRSAGAGTLAVTNAYGLIINNIDDYAAGFTYTNRWGIFQQGSSDNNYFAGKVLIGTTTVSTYNLDLVGTDARFNTIRVGLGNNSISSNTCVGLSSLDSVTTGSQSSAFGQSSLRSLTSGTFNSSFGYDSLRTCSTTAHNSSYGYSNLYTSVGSRNTSIGSAAFYSLSSGDDNSSIGYNSGRYLLDGATANTTANQSVFIGSATRSFANNQTNEIVIGYNAGGKGTNTIVLGNTSITDTYITAGKLNLSAGTTSKAQINLASSTAPTSPVDGDIWFDGTNVKIRVAGVTKTFTIV